MKRKVIAAYKKNSFYLSISLLFSEKERFAARVPRACAAKLFWNLTLKNIFDRQQSVKLQKLQNSA